MKFDIAGPSHTTGRQARGRIMALLFGAAALLLAGWAGADPPGRVARLGYVNGPVSFSPAGENDWVEAGINRPLVTGDRLWVDAGARAELQVGAAVFRLGGGTSVTLLNLDDRVAQLQLAQGTLNVRVRRLGPQDVVEVDTPNLAYSMRRPGNYRIEVDPAGAVTTVTARDGQAEVYGEGSSYLVTAGQGYRFAGNSLRDYEYLEAPRDDDFDRWSNERDRRADKSVSARYVSRDVIGYEDLDENGRWRPAAGYGNMWVPNRVPAGWVPYRDGHWAWIDPWGWTWVDDAPWGFAVSHYGRWVNLSGTWGWVPGPVRVQPVYAPALVAFIGGKNFQIAISAGNVDGIAWFPLGPRDVYRPSYPVSRRYFNNVNTSNATVNNTTITNVYNNVNVTNVTYINQRVAGAVIAVPAAAFVASRPVARAAMPVSRDAVARGQVTPVAAVAPVQASVHGAAPPGRNPPRESQTRPVVAKQPPPPAAVPFAAKQSALAASPGKPLDAAALSSVKPIAPAPSSVVKLVSPPKPALAPPRQQAVAPGALLPSAAQKGMQPGEGGKGPSRDAQKGPQVPEGQKSLPQDSRKGSQPPDAQKAPVPAATPAQPAVSAPAMPDTRKGPAEMRNRPQPPETQKAPPPPATPPQPAAGQSRPPDMQKAPLPDARKDAPSPASVPKAPDTQKAPTPPAIAPRPPEVQPAPTPPARMTRPPEAQKAPPPPVSVPKPPEVQKAPTPPVSVPKPPEVQRAPPPPVSVPKPPEVQRAPPPPVSVPKPPEVQRAPPPPVSVPKPPEVQRAPPPVSVPKPPEVQRAPVSVPKAPEVQRGPPPPEAQKAPAPKPDAGKPADKRGDKKGEDDEKRKQ